MQDQAMEVRIVFSINGAANNVGPVHHTIYENYLKMNKKSICKRKKFKDLEEI